MRRLVEVREAYRKADFRLRVILFGDSSDVPGRLKGEEPRQQANVELRRMRNAFDEAADESERANLPDDLKERAIEARDELSQEEQLAGPRVSEDLELGRSAELELHVTDVQGGGGRDLTG